MGTARHPQHPLEAPSANAAIMPAAPVVPEDELPEPVKRVAKKAVAKSAKK